MMSRRIGRIAVGLIVSASISAFAHAQMGGPVGGSNGGGQFGGSQTTPTMSGNQFNTGNGGSQFSNGNNGQGNGPGSGNAVGMNLPGIQLNGTGGNGYPTNNANRTIRGAIG